MRLSMLMRLVQVMGDFDVGSAFFPHVRSDPKREVVANLLIASVGFTEDFPKQC